MTVEVPIRTISLTNVRMHWGKKARIARAQRQAVAAGLAGAWRERPKIPVQVTLTRIYPDKRGELDGDNLTSSLKAVRDQVAAWFGTDDRDSEIIWHYEQRERRGGYAVEIRFEER